MHELYFKYPITVTSHAYELQNKRVGTTKQYILYKHVPQNLKLLAWPQFSIAYPGERSQ